LKKRIYIEKEALTMYIYDAQEVQQQQQLDPQQHHDDTD
jgi:hypothetical protein